jgi:hypothetical protein
MAKHYNEAGRRLQAAMISYQMGYKGVDATLKKMPEDADESWAQLAEQILRNMMESASKGLVYRHLAPTDTVQ